MALPLVDTDAGLEYHEQRQVPMRLFAMVLGFAMLAGSSGFMWMIFQGFRQGAAFEPASQLGGFLLLLVFGVLFLAAAGFFLTMAVFLPGHSLFFDRKSKRITCIALALVPWRRERCYAFSDVSSAEVVEHVHEDDPHSFSLRLTFTGGVKVSIGNFANRDLASDGLQRLRQLLASP